MNQYVNTNSSPTFTDVTIASDANLKSNIKTVVDALILVESLRGVEYTLNTDLTSRKRTGLIAQEVELILPDMVVDKADGYKTVSYTDLIGILVEAIKELSQKVKNLENK
jgi:hypothetical protein